MWQQFLNWKTRQLDFQHNTPGKQIKPRPSVRDNGIEMKQVLATLTGVNDKMAGSNSACTPSFNPSRAYPLQPPRHRLQDYTQELHRQSKLNGSNSKGEPHRISLKDMEPYKRGSAENKGGAELLVKDHDRLQIQVAW